MPGFLNCAGLIVTSTGVQETLFHTVSKTKKKKDNC